MVGLHVYCLSRILSHKWGFILSQRSWYLVRCSAMTPKMEIPLVSLGLSFPFVEIGIWAWWRPIRISFLPTFPHNQTLILFGLAVHSTLQRGMAMWPVPAIRFMKKCYVQILGRLLKGKSIPSVPIPPFLPSSCFRSVIRHDGEAWQPSWTERVS